MVQFLAPGSHDVEVSNSTLESGTPVSIASPRDGATCGVVLHPDIFGLRPLVVDTLSHLASLGITALGIEPFSHVSDAPAQLSREEKFELIHRMNDVQQLDDLYVAAHILRTRYSCARVCMLGFCIGGMYAFKAAGSGEFDAVVSCYGMIELPEKWKGEGQEEPLSYLAMDSCSPLLAIVGGRDNFGAPALVENLDRVIHNEHHTEMGSELVVYPDAGHAFMHDPDREEYREADSRDAWAKALSIITNS